MFGNFSTVDEFWNPIGMADATGIDFNPNLFGVTTATGSFTGIGSMAPGSIMDFQFDPGLGIHDGGGGVTPVASIADFWSIGDFSFELQSIDRTPTNDPDSFLALRGTGLIKANGHADTPGIWEFTGNSTNSGVFSWSAGSESVPEPGMLALLGIGLVVLAVRSRRRLELKPLNTNINTRG